MLEHRFDTIIVGTGPGGEGAAMRLAKAGKRVAVVERYVRVGGGCTHWGTIPSKALRAGVQRLHRFTSDPLLARTCTTAARITYPELMKGTTSVIMEQSALRQSFYDRNGVTILEGHASFLDAHRLTITGRDGVQQVAVADTIILAPGSRPWRPPEIDFSHPRVRDADTILSMDFHPRTMVVYGAGVIGCEYTSIFRALQVKIDLLNTRSKLLSFLDDEIIDALAYHLRDQGVVVRHDEEVVSVQPQDDGVVVNLRSGKRIKTDVLLYAMGRTGNTDGLDLDKAGVEFDASRGRIGVNARYQTNIHHIYAVGDVVGWPALASAAYDQGRFAAAHILDANTDLALVQDIPTGIFTSPEISSVGKTERELTAAKIPYEVGRAQFRHLARAQITSETVGMLKLLFHRETREILGIHCFGANATEIIHIGQAILAQKGKANTVDYFAQTTFNYPTMAEAYRVAALNGINRLF